MNSFIGRAIEVWKIFTIQPGEQLDWSGSRSNAAFSLGKVNCRAHVQSLFMRIWTHQSKNILAKLFWCFFFDLLSVNVTRFWYPISFLTDVIREVNRGKPRTHFLAEFSYFVVTKHGSDIHFVLKLRDINAKALTKKSESKSYCTDRFQKASCRRCQLFI